MTVFDVDRIRDPGYILLMLTAATVRHGSEAHLVRPDCVYQTGCLTAVPPGYQPVRDAMGVAARFTRLWGPSGSGLAGVGPFGNLIAAVANRLKARKIIRDHRTAAAAATAVAVLPPQTGRGEYHNPGAIPVQGGYAPPFIKPANVGLQLTAASGQSPLPPGVRPAIVAAAQLAPQAATAPEMFVQSMVTDRVGGMVGQRAGAALLRPWIGKRTGSW